VTATPSHQDNWEQHWEEYHQSAAENPAQSYRREVIFSLLGIEGGGKGTRILDIGSGQGDMIAAVRQQYPDAELLGVELSHSGVAISTRKVPAARFVQRDLLQRLDPLPQFKGWATHAICSEVIEHIDDPALLLRNARQYMAPDCHLALTAPGGPMSAFDKHIGHRKHWRPDAIERVLRDAGYEPQRVSGVGFPFFNLYRCLVILRGRKLIQDVSASPSGAASPAARAAMAVFQRLIRLNLNSLRHGWQMVAQARVP
jgi:SAM-dependent methyltransferase